MAAVNMYHSIELANRAALNNLSRELMWGKKDSSVLCLQLSLKSKFL